MYRPRTFDHAPHLSRATLQMALGNGDPFNNDLIFSRQCAHDDTSFPFVFAGHYFDGISFFDVHKLMVRRLREQVPR